METCTVEIGLLKKKPCGQSAVAHCLNCEQPLCAKHAVAELTATGRKTGKFLCKDCEASHRAYQQGAPVVEKSAAPPPPSPAKKPDEAAKDASAKPAGKEAPTESKPAEKKDDGGIDFTPTKK